MEMRGERVIAAARSDVWAALNNPDVLKACIPGCQEMVQTSDTAFSATVKQKVGPVSATFKGDVELTDIVEGESYRIVGEGKGGAAGFAKGGATVTLADDGVGTKLTYDAEAKVGGKLAQLGSRLIDGFAKKTADDFFTRFQETVEGPAESAAAPAAASAAASAAGQAASPAPEPAKAAAAAANPASANSAPASSAPADPAPAAAAPTPEPEPKKSWFARLFG